MESKRKLHNAFLINFNNLLYSTTVKFITIIIFIVSFVFSFFPLIAKNLFSIDNIVVLVNNYFVILGICFVFQIFIVLMITRIGAQIGFQKGNKVTEIILTSIDKGQFYRINILSSFTTVIVVLLIIYLPVFVAGLIRKADITIMLDNLSYLNIGFLVLHVIFTTLFLIIVTVSITSIVKKSEETGPYLLIILLPVFISNIFFTLKLDMYSGVFSILNFIPVFSLLPSIGKCIIDEIDVFRIVCVLLTDIVWCYITYVVGKKIFIKNISEY